MLTKKQILEHFGLEENDELDKYVDFEALARSIENPTRVAVCHILDKGGKVVMSEGKPAKAYREIANEAELKDQSLVFVEWWD